MRVLIADKAITSIGCCPRLDVEQVAQVLEDLHLVAVVFTVILDVPLALPQVPQHLLLLLLLDLKVLVERFHVGHQPLIRIRDVLGLTLNPLLECLENVRLHVVRVELRLVLLVVLELRAHVFGDLLLFELHLVDNGVIVLLLNGVVFLNLSHPRTQRSELLNARGQLSFLLLDLLLDLLHQSRQLLQRLALVVVKLLFQFRSHVYLVLDGGVPRDSLLLLQLFKQLINVAGAALEDVTGALKNLDFSLELLERLLALLVLQVLLLEIGGVLTEVVTLEVLAALDLLVALLFVGELLLQGHFLSFEALDLLSLLVLLLLRGLGLTAINGQLIIGLLGLDLALEHLTFTLQPILVCSETLQLSLSRLWLIQNHLNSLKSVFFIGELPSEMVVQMFAVLSGLIAQVV